MILKCIRQVAKWKIVPRRLYSRNFDLEKIKQNNFKRSRGKAVELEEVCQIIRQEGPLDLCVIQVPAERRYVEHFIICTPRNDSQLVTIPSNLCECKF